MKEIKTSDNSITFHNDSYDETYHSVSGAIEEAVEKFIKPCRIEELAKMDKITILDICFGIGYNSCAAIDAIWKINPNCHITIIALENDEEIINKIENLSPNFNNYSHIKALARTKLVENDKITLKLIIDDARTSIKQLTQEFDAVFLDPFSPKKCPELWTEEFFKDIYRVMKPNTILATYSCARSVRDNLNKAGFKTEDGPSIGRKAPSTIAIK